MGRNLTLKLSCSRPSTPSHRRSPSSVRLAFKYVLVQQRKAYETINAQSLLLQQLSGEAKRHESQLQVWVAFVCVCISTVTVSGCGGDQ
jgi:hypothetical protein